MRKILVILLLVLKFPVVSPCQGFYFGRNKIQYENFNWQVLETEHFNIYFYPEMRELAGIGARFAEDSYVVLESKFNISMTRKIPLIFYSTHIHFQQTNVIPNFLPEGIGGFFEYMKGRVVIPNTGSLADFKETIQHELVHVFTHTVVNRVQKDHKIFNITTTPLWLLEGIAEYWSRDWNSQGEMIIRDLIFNNRFVPIQNFDILYGTFILYKESENLLHFISENYGEEKLLLLFKNFWQDEKFSKVFENTMGKSYYEVSREWIYSLTKKYYPLLKERNFADMVAENITYKGFNVKPAYYNDGNTERVLFVTNRSGYTDIVEADLNKRVRKRGRLRERKIVQVIQGERNKKFEAFHLLRSKIDVNKKGKLAFVSKSGEKDILYLADVTTGKVIDSFKFDNLVSIASPSWSPDNNKILFEGLAVNGKNDIYLLDLETRKEQNITDDFYDDRDPCWSPNGEFIVFSSDRSEYGEKGAYNLFLLYLTTGEIRYLTYGNHKDFAPAWSNDGKYLAFTSDREGVSNLFLMKTELKDKQGKELIVLGAEFSDNGSLRDYSTQIVVGKIKNISNFVTSTFDPEWTEDGSLLFSAFHDYSFQIKKLSNVEKRFNEIEHYYTPFIDESKEVWRAEEFSIGDVKNAESYKKRYSLDFAQTQVSQDPIFGTNGGAAVSITDMLGNDQYFFLLYNNARSKGDFFNSFNFSVSRYSLSRRANLGYGLFHFSGPRYNRAELFYEERRYGGFFVVHYPISMFKRFEFSTNFNRSDKEWSLYTRRKALLFSNYISYVKDNSIWGPTGPLDGERFLITLGKTKDITYNNVNYYTFLIDYRKYFRITNRMCFASRWSLQAQEGKEALRFFIGGSWSLRGYPRWDVWGQRIILISNEFRFPLLDILGLGFPFGGISFRSIRGALFFDYANVTEKQFLYQRWDKNIGSFGFGARMNVGGVFVLRIDFAKRIQNNFKAISNDVYTQFFFGWDF